MKDRLIQILNREFEYTDDEARMTAEDLLSMRPELITAMERWLRDRIDPDLSAEGITTSWLIGSRGYNPLSALLAMDWLGREPERARKLILKDTIK
jgi:hypothetical protein